MNVIWFLLPIAILLGTTFLVAFIIAARNGQYDDLETPAHRMLLDDSSSTERKRNKT